MSTVLIVHGRPAPRCGDIGVPERTREYEPMPESVPEPERTPAPAPAEPIGVPA